MRKVVIKGQKGVDIYICEALYFDKGSRTVTLHMTNPMSRNRSEDISVYLGANDQMVISGVSKQSPSVNGNEV
jgi:hypothetical protein